PAQYTCTGVGESPPLAFSGVPAGAQSFVLILSDPDAPSGDFVHWVVYNIDPAMRAVPAGTVPEAGSLGRSGTGQQEYVPPCLPSGTHRYLFHLYALDTLLSFYAPPTKTDLLTSMQGHVLAEVELMGRFWRL
ncbi:MAG: YbhB/YbcL family Raf kinase inhibitor-like protein, partial [Candidatus Peribacteraceae bacterium]|nr:YbhB/YbcL family Raf kinase inhibitor-like protein [Candidatus Peribacteraceae bacterium]